jgi:hypothetical protein
MWLWDRRAGTSRAARTSPHEHRGGTGLSSTHGRPDLHMVYARPRRARPDLVAPSSQLRAILKSPERSPANRRRRHGSSRAVGRRVPGQRPQVAGEPRIHVNAQSAPATNAGNFDPLLPHDQQECQAKLHRRRPPRAPGDRLRPFRRPYSAPLAPSPRRSQGGSNGTHSLRPRRHPPRAAGRPLGYLY